MDVQRPHISVVIPVYRGEGSLRELHRRLVQALEGITDRFEIIMVEDCGGDRSWDVIVELSASDPRVKGIQFSRNFGQHFGITAGLDHAEGDWTVVMDCDLQDRPEEIPKLYAKALEGYDVVLARRMRRKHPALKRFSSKVFYAVFSYLADIRYDGSVGNFRIISRNVVESFRDMRENLRFFGAMVDWMGFPTAYVDVEHAEGVGGSAYTYGKLFRLAFDTIVAYSDKPLRLSVWAGFSIAGVSFLYGLYFLYRAIFIGVPVEGWSSIIVTLFFLGGIIIANLGVIGIYLGKTFDETKKRPLYIIRTTTMEDTRTGGRRG